VTSNSKTASRLTENADFNMNVHISLGTARNPALDATKTPSQLGVVDLHAQLWSCKKK